MKNIKFSKVSSWKGGAVYHATDGSKTIPFEVSYHPDRIGVLKRVECSQLPGMFEEYKMSVIKNRIKLLF
jgi:hypothetical protein